MRADRINYHGHAFASLQQAQRRCHNRAFGTGADQNKFVGPHLAQQPVNPRLIKWVNTAFMQNDLPVFAKYISRQVCVAVGHENCPVTAQRVRHLLLSLCPVYTVSDGGDTIVIGMNLAGRNYGDVSPSCPGHDAPNVAEDPAVIPDARITGREQKISLRIDVYYDSPAPSSNQLPYHLSDLPGSHSAK
jgi:hypothetical protein